MSAATSLGSALSALEKAHYPFAAYPRAGCASVLFPGCSMTSQFPRTTSALATLCRRMGMGAAYDCCAASVAACGKDGQAERALGRLRTRLEGVGCTEVVLACPTCHAHLAGRLGIRCVSIYEKLLQWHEGPRAGELAALLPAADARPRPRGVLFTPCPDRASRAWETQARMLVDLGDAPTLRGVPCCGLKPELARRGPGAQRGAANAIFSKAAGQTIYTTCASCAGQFARMGYGGSVRHVLGVLLGVDEAPDCAHAVANRARRKFDRDLGPLEGSR